MVIDFYNKTIYDAASDYDPVTNNYYYLRDLTTPWLKMLVGSDSLAVLPDTVGGKLDDAIVWVVLEIARRIGGYDWKFTASRHCWLRNAAETGTATGAPDECGNAAAEIPMVVPDTDVMVFASATAAFSWPLA